MRTDSRTEMAPAGSERLGAIVGWGFGTAWAVWGITGIDNATVRVIAIVLAAVLAIGTAVVVLRADWSARPPRQLPDDWRRRYNLLVLAEFAAIFLAAAALGRAGRPEWIPVAICLIVGLHFLPLAGVFAMPTYRWTAMGLCAVAIAGAALLTVTSAGTARAVVGLAAALVLWASAVWIVRVG